MRKNTEDETKTAKRGDKPFPTFSFAAKLRVVVVDVAAGAEMIR